MEKADKTDMAPQAAVTQQPGAKEQGESLRVKFFKHVSPVIYGGGAAIVLVGALFKIMNWPGAGPMLVVGLSTEALLFIMGIFEPPEKKLDWAIVYPELEGGTAKARPQRAAAGGGTAAMSADMAAMATKKIEQEISVVAKQYVSKMEELTQTLAHLNTVYGKESEQADVRMKSSESIYKGALGAVEAMQSAGKDAEGFRKEMTELKEKVAQLNTIYANTLASFTNK